MFSLFFIKWHSAAPFLTGVAMTLAPIAGALIVGVI